MKKKLLSLVLVGAMVASTSVSAFADTVSSEIYEAKVGTTYDVTDERDANIKIEGRIADDKNEVTPSTISVTVPTAAKFTVDSAGKLIGSNIHITSQGDTKVQVIAHKFTDANKENEINAVSLDELERENEKQQDVNRNKVYLKLTGDDGAFSLQSTNGICGLNNSTTINGDENKVLGTIGNGENLQLRLEGKAVTAGTSLTSPVSDSFTLVLKLKKVNS